MLVVTFGHILKKIQEIFYFLNQSLEKQFGELQKYKHKITLIVTQIVINKLPADSYLL